MRLDDLGRKAGERARQVASDVAALMDPEEYRRRTVRRSRLAAVAAVTAAIAAVSIIVLADPRPGDPTALPTTTMIPDTTAITPPAVPPSGPPHRAGPPPRLGAGWEELDPGPLADRYRPTLDFQSRVSATWTGSELFVWDPMQPGLEPDRLDVFLYNPETGAWREGAPYPGWTCPPRSVGTTVMAGDHVVVVALPGCAAAYHPPTDTWTPLDVDLFRRIDQQRHVVWTGEFLVAPTLGLAFRWQTGTTVPVPVVAGNADVAVHSPQRPHWTGDRVLTIGSGPLRSWAPGDDEWEVLADPPVPERARSSAWTDQGLLVVNYDMAAAFYDHGEWDRPGDVPLRFYECSPEAFSIGGIPAMFTCSGIAVWDEVREAWVVAPVHDVELTSWPGIVATDDSLFAIGRSFLRRLHVERAEDGSIVVPPTIPVGVMQLDIPDGFALVSSFAPQQDPAGFIGEDSTIGFVFTADGGRHCVVSSEYRGGELITEETFGVVAVLRDDRTELLAVILAAPGNGARFAVEASTSDVVIVSCEASSSADAEVAEADAWAFLSGLWSPWEEPGP